MIDKATVKRILDTADIVEVVSDYVSLTRRGANYMGLCPFHNERTPSFSVSPARGICHCFSCGKGGSPVNFIMEKEGINFHDALLHLATKYGIKVEERELSDEERAEQSQRESMLMAGQWAMQFFEQKLTQTQDGRDIGLSYLYSRGITDDAIKRFHLGYAPDAPTALYDAAKGQGIEPQTLFDTGLCGKNAQSGRVYDRFRGRVIFPVLSPAGKVIAFGGRGIKGEAAKYINSPESLVYRKSNELYGIYQAKNAIVRQKKCYLVEGYMDVIAMWQSGLENTVASSGTSLTDGQIALIHRFTESVTLIYDGDAAGIKASLRGIDLLLSHKLDIKVLLLPDGDDPDSFSRKKTPEEFREYIARGEEDFIAFKTRILLGNSQSMSAAEKAEAISSVVTSIASVPDLVKRSLYVQQTATLMGVSEQILSIEVSKALERVTQEQRRRHRLQRIETEYPTRGTTPGSGTLPAANSGASNYSATAESAATQTPIQPANVDSRLAANSASSPTREVELHVLEYVVRYGMMAFCDASIPDADETEPQPSLNVAEFVHYELTDDNMVFSVPLYARLFERIMTLIPAYKRDEAEMLSGYVEQQRREYNEWVEAQVGQALSVQQIEKAERDFAERQADERTAYVTDYACAYIGRELGSDPDDELRRLVLKIITPRYSLSKYHNKGVHVATERERLVELLARALSEWKDVLLSQRYAHTQQQLRAAAAQGDTTRQLELVAVLQQISDLRRQVAKTIGERILSPKKI